MQYYVYILCEVICNWYVLSLRTSLKDAEGIVRIQQGIVNLTLTKLAKLGDYFSP